MENRNETRTLDPVEVSAPDHKGIGADVLARLSQHRAPIGGVGPILQRIAQRFPNSTPSEILRLLRSHILQVEPPFGGTEPPALHLGTLQLDVLRRLIGTQWFDHPSFKFDRPLFDLVIEPPYLVASGKVALASEPLDADGRTTGKASSTQCATPTEAATCSSASILKTAATQGIWFSMRSQRTLTPHRH